MLKPSPRPATAPAAAAPAAAASAPVTIHMPLAASPQIQRIMRLLDKLPATHELRLRDQFQINELFSALTEIRNLLLVCPAGMAHRIEAEKRLDALFEEVTRQQNALIPSRTRAMPWPKRTLPPTVPADYAFSQDIHFPDYEGVCDTLSCMFIELRALGKHVKDILAILSEQRHHDAIVGLQLSDLVMQSHRGLGRGLLEARWYAQVHAYCKAIWGGMTCPTMREVGCFPAGVSLYMDRGPKAFAVRLPNGGAMYSRTSRAPSVLTRKAMFRLHQSLSEFDAMVSQLFRQAEAKPGLALFKVNLVIPYFDETGVSRLTSHIIVVELTPGHRGVFDPNLGWIPLTKGWNDVLTSCLLHLSAEQEAAGLIAYQYVPTPRPCHCKMPRDAKGK